MRLKAILPPIVLAAGIAAMYVAVSIANYRPTAQLPLESDPESAVGNVINLDQVLVTIEGASPETPAKAPAPAPISGPLVVEEEVGTLEQAREQATERALQRLPRLKDLKEHAVRSIHPRSSGQHSADSSSHHTRRGGKWEDSDGDFTFTEPVGKNPGQL